MKLPSFYEVLNGAISDMMIHGFDSRERLDSWMKQLAVAAQRSLVPEATLQDALRSVLERVYHRSTSMKALLKVNPRVTAFTLNQIKPRCRAELDRRILASANLIKLNREAAIAKTLQRFAGWATSIPLGGTNVTDRAATKKEIRRGLSGLSFEERRVAIDQGAKLAASINAVVAEDGGAIALTWRHVMERGHGYQPRPEHVARNGEVFVLRDNWAIKDGLIKLAGRQYYDEVTAVAEEPFCRCSAVYIFSLRDLPPEMLTSKGKEVLLDARRKLKQIA